MTLTVCHTTLTFYQMTLTLHSLTLDIYPGALTFYPKILTFYPTTVTFYSVTLTFDSVTSTYFSCPSCGRDPCRIPCSSSTCCDQTVARLDARGTSVRAELASVGSVCDTRWVGRRYSCHCQTQTRWSQGSYLSRGCSHHLQGCLKLTLTLTYFLVTLTCKFFAWDRVASRTWI